LRPVIAEVRFHNLVRHLELRKLPVVSDLVVHDIAFLLQDTSDLRFDLGVRSFDFRLGRTVPQPGKEVGDGSEILLILKSRLLSGSEDVSPYR
jgi:hypothetical protein